MLHIDEHTSIHSWGKCARLCIEVDLQRELVMYFKTLGKEFKIEHEVLHLIYFGYGKYSHRLETCPNRKSLVASPPGNSQNPSQTPVMGGDISVSSESPSIDFNGPSILETSNLESKNLGIAADNVFRPWMIAKKKKGKMPQCFGSKF